MVQWQRIRKVSVGDFLEAAKRDEMTGIPTAFSAYDLLRDVQKGVKA